MLKESKNLEHIFVIKTFWLLLFAIVIRFSNFHEDFSYIILSFYAFLGPIYAIEALVFCFLFRSLNIYFNINSTFEISYLVIISSVISTFWHSKLYIFKIKTFFISPFFLFTIFFGFFLLFHGFFLSKFMLISILKSFVWFFLIMSLLIAFSSLSHQETEMLQKRFFWLFLIVALISLALHFIPVIGYAHDGRGLQGIFSHPQKFGIIFSLLSSIILIILLNQKIFSLKTIFFLIVLIFYLTLTFLSASRTAIFSFFLSVLIFIFCSIFFRKQNFLKTYNFFHNKNFRILSIVLLFFAIFFYYYYYTFFLNFFDKGQNAKNILQVYLYSRMPAFDPIIENIKTSWLTGIGFGLPSLQNYRTDNEISNTFFRAFYYEKGNLFLLVLEELGVLGFLIFILWLFFLIRVTILSSNNIALIVIINIILLNLGEAVLFSTGGLGLFTLIFLCWAVTRSNLTSKKSHENFS